MSFSAIKSTEGRKNAYRAIVQVRPPHLNDVYLATQVHISVLITPAKFLHLCVQCVTLTIVQINHSLLALLQWLWHASYIKFNRYFKFLHVFSDPIF